MKTYLSLWETSDVYLLSSIFSFLSVTIVAIVCHCLETRSDVFQVGFYPYLTSKGWPWLSDPFSSTSLPERCNYRHVPPRPLYKVQGIKHSTLHMLGTYYATELHFLATITLYWNLENELGGNVTLLFFSSSQCGHVVKIWFSLWVVSLLVCWGQEVN